MSAQPVFEPKYVALLIDNAPLFDSFSIDKIFTPIDNLENRIIWNYLKQHDRELEVYLAEDLKLITITHITAQGNYYKLTGLGREIKKKGFLTYLGDKLQQEEISLETEKLNRQKLEQEVEHLKLVLKDYESNKADAKQAKAIAVLALIVAFGQWIWDMFKD